MFRASCFAWGMLERYGLIRIFPEKIRIPPTKLWHVWCRSKCFLEKTIIYSLLVLLPNAKSLFNVDDTLTTKPNDCGLCWLDIDGDESYVVTLRTMIKVTMTPT